LHDGQWKKIVSILKCRGWLRRDISATDPSIFLSIMLNAFSRLAMDSKRLVVVLFAVVYVCALAVIVTAALGHAKTAAKVRSGDVRFHRAHNAVDTD
jgi:hypothetical protein